MVQAPEQSFELAFMVDEEGNATVLGNNGSASVYQVQAGSGEGVTFIEVTAAGSVMTTAIASNGSSAHSRNTIIDGDIVPSQYYGHCETR